MERILFGFRYRKSFADFPVKLLSLVPTGFSKLFMVISSESNIIATTSTVFESQQKSLI